MAGFGRKKRSTSSSSSSSSSCSSLITAAIFLAFCALGVWVFTSSNAFSPRVSRTALRSLTVPRRTPTAFDDNPGELPDDAIKGDHGDRAQHQEEAVEISEDGKEDEPLVSNVEEAESEHVEEKVKIEEDVANEGEGEKVKIEEVVNEGVEEKGKSEDEVVNGDEDEKKKPSVDRREVEKLIGEEEENAERSEAEKTRDEEEENADRREAEKLRGEAEENADRREAEEVDKAKGNGEVEEKVRVEGDDGDGGSRKESSYTSQGEAAGEIEGVAGQNWELCNATAGADYIPCLDNEKALKLVHITGHFEHRERHCPEEGPKCLVPLPKGYRRPIEWPRSRDMIWYNNVPHTKLAEVKGHQNWVKVAGEYLNFPGGGTQFIHGALHYIDFIQKGVPRIAWGKHTRVILDVGCGVASFGGYLFDRDVLAMSFAPKDEHEAQVQFALERGIPAISAVMGTQRLPFPSRVFDIVHCARCRVPWHAEGGRLLLELNRVLRPGGYFVWSATPVYQKLEEDVQIWKDMSELTVAMCWDLVTIKKDKINSIGAAVYRKPVTNECYESRKNQTPPMCAEDDDASAAWYVPLQSCMHRVPIHSSERGSQWPADWPQRVEVPPYWLNGSEMGIYGKPPKEDFSADYKRWKKVVEKSYLNGMGISWSKIRNVMDMKAVYGGFAAALKDLSVWVMNVVNIDSSQDTLPIIYERGLFGIYHDWCESFSTYPRTYDLLHADHLFSGLKKRCDILPVIVEVDRIIRPGGTFIVRDEPAITSEVANLLKSLRWDVRMTFSEGKEGILCAEKTDWRPEAFSSSS